MEGNFRELYNFVERILVSGESVVPLSAQTCRRALDVGALSAVNGRAIPSPAITTDWSGLASRAVESFVEDHGHAPRN